MAASTHSPDVTARHRPDGVRFIHGKSHIGRYELMFAIDMGGMAAVYAGRLAGPAGFEKLVALKIIYPHLAAEESFIHMFFDEARIVAGIRHPNVAEIYEVGQDEGVYFMAMELIEGHSLHALAHKVHETKTKIPHEIYADIVAKVCRGAHDAHELRDADGKPLNLVHRDISPRNVLVSNKGAIKLIDFGVAWAEERLTHTKNGAAKGKVGYMPPEYIRGESPDRRSDVFALGVVLYNLLTAAHPYPGRTDAERIDSILKGKVVRPSELLPEIDGDLEAIILKAIHIDPNQRYATALQMADALEAFCRRSDVMTGPDQLAVLIGQLFESESKELTRKIRKYRKRHPKSWETPTVGTPTGQIDTNDSDSDITEQLTDSEVMFAERGTMLERVEEEPRQISGRQRWVLVASAAMALVLAALAWQLTRSSNARPSLAIQPPDKPAVELNPPTAHPVPVAPSPAPQSEVVRIRFDIEGPEAAASLDGVTLAPTIREVVVRRDGTTHTLEFSRPGFISKRVTFEAAESQDLRVVMERLPSRHKSGAQGDKLPVKMLSNPFN